MRCTLSLLAVLGLASVSSAQQAHVGWWDAPTLTAGPYVDAALAADLDGDGLPDRIAGHYTAKQVSIQRGTHDGVPALPSYWPTIDGVKAMQVADLDLDGSLDLVGVNPQLFSSSKMIVMLGDGAGGLLPPASYAPQIVQPDVVVLADITGDGAIDAVISSANASAVAVMPGDGAGGLLTPVVHFGWPGPEFPGAVTVGDITGDGLLDAILPAYSLGGSVGSYALSVFSLTGGALVQVDTLPEAVTAWAATTVDLDGNGLVDVVTALKSGGLLGVRLQTAPGVLSAETTVPMLPSWSGGAGLPSFGDLDGDGAIDGVAILDGKLIPLSGDGRGALVPGAPLATGPFSVGTSLADLDFDGRTDLLLGFGSKNLDGGLTGILRGDGAGGVLNASRVTLGPSPARGLASADMDGDGIADLAAALGDANALAVLRGDGQGGLLPPLLLDDAPTPVDVAWGDFDGDGAQDLAAALDGSDKVRVQLGDGAGAFGAPIETSTILQPGILVAGDLNGDGRLDAVVGTAQGAAGKVAVHLGLGGGALAPASVTAGSSLEGMALGDLDGDGNLDVAGAGTSEIQLWRGDGAGGLLPAAHFHLPTPPAYQPRDVAFGDVDTDGVTDLIFAGSTGTQAGVLARLAWDGGALSLVSKVDLPIYCDGLALADGDGDGDLDAALTSSIEGLLGWQWNDGHGAFTNSVWFFGGGKTDEPVVMDLDLDGLDDLVALDAAAPQVVVVHAIPSPWIDLGHSLAGAAGEPSLAGEGALLPDSPGRLDVTGAKPFAPISLFVSTALGLTSFHGGTLVPAGLDRLVLPADADGALHLSWDSLPALPTGVNFYLQAWMPDAAAPQGVAATNGLSGSVP